MREYAPSDTARLVARGVLLASQDSALATLLAPGEAQVVKQILDQAGGAAGWNFAIRNRMVRPLLFRIERLMLPGIIAHYLARKRRIEIAVREALERGVRQVVVIGAGFDSLAWRLHSEFPEVAFLELDHPATQKVKCRALGTAANFHYGAVDLVNGSLREALEHGEGYDAAAPAVLVAEGLTMYLSAAEVERLLRDAVRSIGASGTLVFTFMNAAADGSISFRDENPWVKRWLGWKREPFRWGMAAGLLPEFLRGCGLEADAVVDDVGLRPRVLEPRGLGHIALARGECICECHVLE